MVSNTRLSVLISLYVSVDAETDIHGSVKIFNKFPWKFKQQKRRPTISWEALSSKMCTDERKEGFKF